MTYEEFCKRIEEELSTDNPLRFRMSDKTINDLLAKSKKTTVNGAFLYLDIDDEPIYGHFVPLPLMVYFDKDSGCWRLYQFRQYIYSEQLIKSSMNKIPVREVIL